MANSLTPRQQLELAKIEELVENEVFLGLSVLDVQTYDDTLVVLTDDHVPRAFVRVILKQAWSGEVEVYCANGLMMGSTTALS